MIRREMLLPPHIASMFILLVFDYSLPMELTIGETVVVPEKGNRQRCVLKKVTVNVEEQNDDYLEAALLILNIL